jgi:two-component system, chemotaxis family, protein-glutamate methylesterase/glutaminase
VDATAEKKRAHTRAAPAVPPIVAIAASAGGIQALSVLLDTLQPSFPAAVLVVLHISPRHPSQLPTVLGRHTQIEVENARDGEVPRPGHAYLAPADRHLLLGRDGRLQLSSSAPVNFARPAADVLFESVAAAAGHNAIGVVLSGTGKDGTDGIGHIKRAGGFTIAQDEGTSGFWGMPGSAIQSGAIDRVLPIDQIAALLRSLAGRSSAS